MWGSDSKYYKHGNELFNINALLTGDRDFVFITEGQIDAMSFMEIGLDAVGLGGVNEVSKLINQLKDHPCDKIFVLALDNDKAGRRATGKFIEEFAEAELDQQYIVISNLYGVYKDANEYLVADREGFIERMKEIVNK